MKKNNNSAKWQLLLMIGMVVGVMIAGYLVFPKSDQERATLLEKLGTTNHGELILSPVDISQLSLVTEEGKAWQFAEQKIKWRLLLVAGKNCSQSCEELLYLSRQMHLRLGKYANRFERLYLTTADWEQLPLEQLNKEHPYLGFVRAEAVALNQWLEKMQLGKQPEEGIALLVDQQGLVMMQYGIEHDGVGMLDDLNHLMKYSPDR